MASQNCSEVLLRRVRQRLLIAQLARKTLWVLLILAAIYGVALLVGRLTGLLADVFFPWQVAALPVVAGLVAAGLPGRPSLEDAARRIDRHQGTKDLFLTVTMLERAAGDYKPLVTRDAEARAPRVKPREVVPFEWERGSVVSAGTLALLLLGAFFVPVFDPFGKVAEANQESEQRKLLEQTKKVTEIRRAQLAEKDVEAENSEGVEKALERLKVGFGQMKKGDRQANQKRLNLHQTELGKIYRALNSGELRKLFNENKIDQQFGAIHDEDLFRKMQRELQQGSSESLEKELESIKSDLERLMKSDDPVERSELQRKIKQKLKELSDFASDKAGSKALHAALERAMQQMEAGKNSALSKEAMQALEETLDVAQKEVASLAQSARDMKSLEEALKMISMAKQMNAQDQLDGEMMGGEMTLEEYEEMYAQLMGMPGDGDGLGNEGMGEGDVAPEDDSVKTDFVDEKSKSAIQKGKILLSMKTKGLSDTGEIKDEEYKRIVGEIKQSLEDVIEQEQIPPGYVESIKSYFDAIGNEPAAEDGAGR